MDALVYTTSFKVKEDIEILYVPTVDASGNGPALNNPVLDIVKKFETDAKLSVLVVDTVHDEGLKPHEVVVSIANW